MTTTSEREHWAQAHAVLIWLALRGRGLLLCQYSQTMACGAIGPSSTTLTVVTFSCMAASYSAALEVSFGGDLREQFTISQCIYNFWQCGEGRIAI